jgi:2,4-dienoyl-CoA reductase (NADPH2)
MSTQQKFGKDYFPNIFKPGKIGRFIIPNRVKHAACSISNYNSPQGFITDREFYRDQVIGKTGAGIITNQGAYPDPEGEGKGYWRQLALYDDRFVPGINRIAQVYRKEAPNALILFQITHTGRYGGLDIGYTMQPSVVPQKLPHFGSPPREMTVDDIKRYIGYHANCARLAIQAGFDGIELTCFQGYLLANFNSRFTNRRTDEYGGSLEKRARFMVEVIQAVRKEIGTHLVIGIRLSGLELLGDLGNTAEECVELAKIAEDNGVDYISMVIGWHESDEGALGRMHHSDRWLFLCETWRKALKVPLTFGPCLQDPHVAEKAIADGLFDYWELCRPMLADPERIHKIAKNDLAAIKPCIGDLMCMAKGLMQQPYICTLNPLLGHEGEEEFQTRPAVRKKTVMVIGAGLAGIEAALAAAKKGHHVSIYDQKGRIGGQLLSFLKEQRGGWNHERLIEYYEEQLRRSGIDVHLGVQVDEKLIKKVHPDVGVLTSGSKIELPLIPGIEGKNIHTTFDVMERGVSTGDRVSVIHGGKVGIITALYLSTLGKKVTLIHEGERPVEKVPATWRWRYTQWLRQYQINVINNSRPISISNSGITISKTDGSQNFIECDTIVFAKRVANQDLLDFLQMNCDELFIAGDAIRPRYLHTAVHEGFKAGNGI